MVAVHKRSQLRVACCYCAVSYRAATVISGNPPIQQLAKERVEFYKGSSNEDARSKLMSDWQRECPQEFSQSGIYL